MKKTAKVSVIIPVYNVDQYLSKCLDSVLSQSYTNIEIIIVNDGSTDNTAVICSKYALEDNRFRIINKKNTGVSDSRNCALEVAMGDFLIFLDADDFWRDTSFLFRMVAYLTEEDADICCADYKEVDSLGNDLKTKSLVVNEQYLDNRLIEPVTFLSDVLNGNFFLWRCLIRRKSIGNLRFNTNRIFLEDAEFYLRLFHNTSLKCMYLPVCFYSYRKHKDSVTVKKIPEERKLKDAFDFTRFCFSLSSVTVDATMKDYLIKKGVDNYMFDIFSVGLSKKSYKYWHYFFEQWNIFTLQNEVRDVVKKNKRKFKYKLIFLPLEVQLKYYQYRFHTKSFIKKILNKIIK